MESNYQYLIERLDEFIRKYYKNRMLRGFIYFITFSLAFYLSVVIPEYFAYFSTTVRTLLFYGFIFINFIILFIWVLIPLFRIYKIGKVISHEQAARIIGTHFSNVQDKLLNTLELKELADRNPYNKSLIEASINQRIAELKPIPFTLAIDFRKNLKYLRYAAVPLLLLISILIASPGVITKSTKRILQHNQYFEKEAPFRFEILNDNLQAVRQEDFLLKVKVSGEEIPETVFLNIGASQYKLKKENNVTFSYLFKNLQKDVVFSLTDGEFESKPYNLKVLPNPVVLNFQVSLTYPAYLGKKPETIYNAGDLVVPEGTFIQWSFFTKDAENLRLRFNDSLVSLNGDGSNRFQFSRYLFRNNSYTVSTQNRYVLNKDSVSYTATVIPDLYPEIRIEEFKDSVFDRRLYFTGQIKDDYGFSALAFVYKVLKRDNDSVKAGAPVSQNLNIVNGVTEQQFFHYWDISQLDIPPGSDVEYYFEVWDNDGVNGRKSTKSQSRFFRIETAKEIEEKIANANKEIKDKLEESIKLAKEIQNELKALNLKMLEKNNITWEEKRKIENLMEKHKQLEQNIKQIQQENEKKNQKSSQLTQQDENILRKQEQLQQMFEKLMTDEMKKMFEELKNLLENQDKNKTMEMLEKMNLSGKDLEKELDRNLELFKQLEVQQKLDNAIQRIDELKEKQEKLAEQSLDKNKSSEELKKQQDALNKEFQDFRKDMDELNKLNKELEDPHNLKNTDQQEEEIQQEQQNSSENLGNNKKSKAAQSQKNAAEKMQKLSEDLKNMKQEIEREAYEEDMDNLRSILENLLKISFEQEAIMTDAKRIRHDNPQYVTLIQRQKKIKDDSKVVEDSLLALSKRVIEIESVVNKEVTAMKNNMERAIKAMEQRNGGEAQIRQQTAMTSVNNLALLLSEAQQNMQQQQQNQSKQCKGGKCKKKGNKQGGGKMSIATMKKLQEELNKQIQQLKEQLKDPSKLGNRGKQTLSEQFAKMAAQQEALRNELQRISQSLKNDPNAKTGDMDKIAKEMEQTETDLVNKMITTETLKRQQEILTRLLEHEKAEREREMEEKRESREAKDDFLRNPIQKIQYNITKNRGEELLKTVPPSFNSYYKKKVNEYFNNFEENIQR